MREIRIPGLRRIVRVPPSGGAVDREVDDEIRFHLDARIAELVRQGFSERDARERASAEFGDVDRTRRELARLDRRRLGTEHREELLVSFVEDLAYAARSLARRPALLILTTLTLGVGIAANAIMFGVVNQLLLEPPAHVANAGAIRRIFFRDYDRQEKTFDTGPVTTYPTLPALRQNAPAFAELAALGYPEDYSLGRGQDAQDARVQLVSGNYFHLLGVQPELGRVFVDGDDKIPVGEPVAVVSYGLWRRLGENAGVVGMRLLLQGKTFTVVGVAPRGFSGIDRDRVDVWLPISSFAKEAHGDGWYDTHNNWWLRIVGRVRDGASPEVAAAQATSAYRALARAWNQPFRDTTSSVVLSSLIGTRKPDGISPESRVSLWLLGVSAIVLLIACANVANLLIVRTLERRREIAVRIALGVSRGRLVRMLLTEAALLAALGAAVACAIAFGASRLVEHILLPNIVWSESVVDARVLGFTLGVTALCILLAGLAPAVQGSAARVTEGLKASSRQIAGGRGRLRFALMVAQAALSVVLLVGAGLTVRSLRNVASREVGIDRDHVLRVTMPLSRFGFDTAQVRDVFQRGEARLRAIPGVASVSVAGMTVPMGSAMATNFEVPGVARPNLALGGPYNALVSPGFFSTVGAPIVRGRDFTPAEGEAPAHVVIVNETLAKAYWPGRSPIGQCVHFGADSSCSTVVGVVGTLLQFQILNDERAIVYAPPLHPGSDHAMPSAILLRVAGEPGPVVPLVRRALQSLAPTMPYVQIKSYSELVAPQLQPWRLSATMFTLFGVIALLIAGVGLYSVMAYWASQRTHEIGVRMALGAQRRDVVRLIAAECSRAVAVGLAIGAVAALLATRWISSMLYDISPRDPMVYLQTAAVLALAGIVAAVVPARRSTAVDPAQAIRTE